MNSVTLPDGILNIVSQADDDRVIRTLEAVHSGSLTINYRTTGDTITATVQSLVWKGKRNPTCEAHHYQVTVAPHFAECSCPDFTYRGVVCKHLLGTVIVLQESTEQEHKQAA